MDKSHIKTQSLKAVYDLRLKLIHLCFLNQNDCLQTLIVEPGWDGLEPLNHFCPHHLGPQKVSSYLWAAVSPTEPGINISLLPPQASWEPQLRQWMFNCSGIPQKLGKQLCGKGTVPYLLNWRELFCRHSVPPDCESVHHRAKHHDVFSKSYTTLCKLSFLRCKL